MKHTSPQVTRAHTKKNRCGRVVVKPQAFSVDKRLTAVRDRMTATHDFEQSEVVVRAQVFLEEEGDDSLQLPIVAATDEDEGW